MIRRTVAWWTAQRVANAAVVGAVIYVILWALHPSLLLSTTTITGGDTGSHIAAPLYLRQHLGLGSLTSWYPGWYDGFPLYTYYFVLPDALVSLISFIIPYTVAFKLATILGSILMPIAAFAMGKLFRAPNPIPAALSAGTLLFLFDASFTIDGGNLFSTMAGEYSFSLSLALALVTIGLFARGIRTGRGRWMTAIFLSLTLAAHLLPWLYVIVMVALLLILELVGRSGTFDRDRVRQPRHHPRRTVWFVISAGLLSAGFSAWWLLPFATTQQYTNSMGYRNISVDTFREIFTQLGWYNALGGAGGDRWVIVLAGVALLMAFFWRDRLGIAVTLSGVLALVAYVVDPQSAIWNERLVPFWYISIYLSVGWLVGASLFHLCRSRWFSRLMDSWRRHDTSYELTDDETTYLGDRRVVHSTFIVGVLVLAVLLPGIVPKFSDFFGITEGPNQVSNWAEWNYSGYEAKPAWPEYHGIITTMENVARQYGCGRSMWEYNSDQNRFGTTMGLMLLPYWTNNCVGSMEGLFFESSPTTPYHFLNQAELSVGPSNPMLQLQYGGVDVAFGVRHLQELGVRYYLAYSPEIVRAANRDAQLVSVAVTKKYLDSGDRWHVYLIRHSDVVTPLTSLPNVVSGIASRTEWLRINESWWLDPNRGATLIADSGPANWPRQSLVEVIHQLKHRRGVSLVQITNNGFAFAVDKIGRKVNLNIPVAPMWQVHGASGPTSIGMSHYQLIANAPEVVVAFQRKQLAPTSVSRVVMGDQSISFHVSRIGVPLLVKISYYPRWHADGALGPFRVSPNLMVVVPTSHDVALVYGSSPSVWWGNIVTDLTVIAMMVALWRRRRWRRPHVVRSLPKH